jgi:nickel-dependent lactate racemase
VRVQIICDDHTRVTPVSLLVEALIQYCATHDFFEYSLDFAIAGGSHRLMTPEELRDKLGDFCDQYLVHQHNFESPSTKYYGTTSDGTEVRVDGCLAAADVRIGLGNIIPHEIAGFSGGYKILIPGMATQATVDAVHWMSARIPLAKRLGTSDNPIRAAINRAGELVGLDFLINVVLDYTQQVVGVFAGHPVAAHAAGCALAREFYAVETLPATICVAESYPETSSLWVCSKAILHGAAFTERGGILIVTAPCDDGIGHLHPDILEMGYHSPEHLDALLSAPDATERGLTRLSATHCANLWEVLQHCTVFLVTSGLDSETCAALGLHRFTSLKDAIEHALTRKPATRRVLVVRHGSEMMNARS